MNTKTIHAVIPAQAGIQFVNNSAQRTRPVGCPASRVSFNSLDSGLRRNDGVLV